ncbi:hypothetical protein [Kocuria rhizophila]|uniref:hypothetical protein n=1 Tax=Kocuria rhizophila TaxID=72000 RepID=UPI003D6FD7BD
MQRELIAGRMGTPFTRSDWPVLAAPVTIDVTNGVDSHRLFTGRIDGTSSAFLDAGMSIPLVDDSDTMSNTLSHVSLWNQMPPRLKENAGRYRITGVSSTYIADRAARRAGFFNSPRQNSMAVIAAPLAGCTWPTAGELDVSHHVDDPQTKTTKPPVVMRSQKQIYTSEFVATWLSSSTLYTGGITDEYPLNITFGAAGSGTAYVACRWNSFSIRLVLSSNGTLLARYVNETNGTQTTVASLSASAAPGWKFVTLRVTPHTSPYWRFTITTDTGVTATGTTYMPVMAGTTQWADVLASASAGVGLNGMQVSYDSGPPIALGFVPTFQHEPDRPQPFKVMPNLVDVPAGELLQDQAEAENAAVWINEDGILRWLGHQEMISQPASRVIGSSEVADARIELDAQDAKSQVVAAYADWGISIARRAAFEVYRGSGDELMDEEKSVVFASPSDDEEWAGVNMTPIEVQGDLGATHLNRGSESFVGFVPMDAEGNEFSSSKMTEGVRFSFERVSAETLKITTECLWLPAGAERIKLATRSDSAVVKEAYQGIGLPLIRAMGKAVRKEQTYSSAVVPGRAPVLRLDYGWHLQDKTSVKEKVDWLAGELASPRPRVTDFKILPDPRIQLGDKIIVMEAARTGIQVTGIVTSLEQVLKDGLHEMVISLMVIQVTFTSGATLQEFDDFYTGLTLGALDQRFSGVSLESLDALPLR